MTLPANTSCDTATAAQIRSFDDAAASSLLPPNHHIHGAAGSLASVGFGGRINHDAVVSVAIHSCLRARTCSGIPAFPDGASSTGPKEGQGCPKLASRCAPKSIHRVAGLLAGKHSARRQPAFVRTHIHALDGINSSTSERRTFGPTQTISTRD